jgi:hypothetical protein
MSYIQIDIGGKLRGLKFNQGANAEIQSKISSIGNNPVFIAYTVIWAGLVSNAFVKGEEIDFTFEQVCEWADKLDIETTTKISECYVSTLDFQKDLPEEKSKKKLMAKTIKRNALK